MTKHHENWLYKLYDRTLARGTMTRSWSTRFGNLLCKLKEK